MGETKWKGNNQRPAGRLWPLEMPVPGSGVPTPRGQVLLMASLYSQRQAASWAPLSAPGAQAAQSVSILNPLQSRPELGQLPNIALASDTDAEGEVGRHKAHP